MSIKFSNCKLHLQTYATYEFSELTQGTIQDATPSGIGSSTYVSYTYPFVKIKNNKLKIHADSIVIDGVTYTPRTRIVFFDSDNMTNGRLSATKATLCTNWKSAWSGWGEDAFDSEGNAELTLTDDVKYIRFTLSFIKTGGTSDILTQEIGLDEFKETFISVESI